MVISAFGIGVAISLVYLYRNKYNIGYTGLKLYNKIDEFVDNLIDTNYNTYCIHDGDFLKEIESLDDIEDKESYPIFLEKKYLKKNIYYKAHFYDKFELEKDTINLESICDSPIIMCSLTVSNANGILHDQYDVTKIVNSFVFKDCVLILTNQDIYKKMWIMLFNTIFKSKNMFIDSSDLDNIILKWFIILENGDMLDSENHILKIEDGKCIK